MLRDPDVRRTPFVERAIHGRWPSSETIREALVEHQIRTIDDERRPHEAAASFQALITTDADHGDGQVCNKRQAFVPHEPKHTIVIVEDPGWYGNSAHEKVAQRVALPGVDASIADSQRISPDTQ